MNQNDTDYEQLISHLESLARQGQTSEVQKVFQHLNCAKITRQHRFPLAQMARRAGLPMMSLKIMNPLVRSPLPLSEPLKNEEKLIYATTLSFLGSYDEAQEILSLMDSSAVPEVKLNLAFLKIFEWDYRSAIPLLKEYIRLENITDYSRLIGKVNLAAAMVTENSSPELTELLDDILSITEKGQYWLLHANCLELKAQNEIFTKNYSSALNILSKAKSLLLSNGQDVYLRMIQKWERIAECLIEPDSSEKKAALIELRELALKEQHWEVVRDLDLFYAFITDSNSLLQNTLWGTPYLSFRRRALRIWEKEIPLATQGLWQLDTLKPHFQKVTMGFVIIDPRNLQDPGSRSLASHKTGVKAMEILSQDGYRPVMIGSLFRQLYPGEHFDPFHSPRRVENVIFRLRKIFLEYKWPITIRSSGLGFQLVSLDNSFGICLKKYKRSRNLSYDQMSLIKEKLKGKTFSSQDFAKHLNKPLRTSRRLLNWACNKKLLVKIGKGRASRYKFSNHWPSQKDASA